MLYYTDRVAFVTPGIKYVFVITVQHNRVFFYIYICIYIYRVFQKDLNDKNPFP